MICDKGYDSAEFRAAIGKAGSKAVIPPRKYRREQFEYDAHIYTLKKFLKKAQGITVLAVT